MDHPSVGVDSKQILAILGVCTYLLFGLSCRSHTYIDPTYNTQISDKSPFVQSQSDNDLHENLFSSLKEKVFQFRQRSQGLNSEPST